MDDRRGTVERGVAQSVDQEVRWGGDRAVLERSVRSIVVRYQGDLDVSDVQVGVSRNVSDSSWVLELVSSTLTEAQLSWLLNHVIVPAVGGVSPQTERLDPTNSVPSVDADPNPPTGVPPPSAMIPPVEASRPRSNTGQIPTAPGSGQPGHSQTMGRDRGGVNGPSAGWYHARGDPPGTCRYWDGTSWVGAPQQAAANTGPGITVADPIDVAIGSQLRAGRVAFNPPTAMKVGQAERFVVRIVRSTALDQELIAGIERPSETLLSSVQTSYRMKVVCSCTDGLTVRPLSEETQVVATSQHTEWHYTLSAQRHGNQVVWVSASALLGQLPGGVDSIISLPVLHHPVEVTVTPKERAAAFVADNWKWLVATGFALSSGIVAWIGVFSS